MHIVIVGGGKVGSALVRSLSQEDNNICVIDVKSDVVRQLATDYDVMGMVGNGASASVLKEAGIESADLLIAVTEHDELNLLCCIIAKKASKCQTIARVRNPMYSQEKRFLQRELGLSMIINPEQTAASEIASLLGFPSALGIDSFAGGKVEMIRFRIPEDCKLDGKALKEVNVMIGGDFLICAVDRAGQVSIPDGNFVLKSGDNVSLVTSRKSAKAFFEKINMNTNRAKNTMIVGGGKITLYLAKMLDNLGIAVKIIEKDPDRCTLLSEELPHATIINGDGSDETFLKEERIDTMDSFVALTNMDEENILLSLMAKKKVSRKVITKINREQLNEVIHNLDIDSVVYPKLLTAQKILRYSRATKNSIGSNVKTLYRMYDDKVEALEFVITENSKIAGIPLRQMKRKKGLLIGAIIRNDKLIIPDGQAEILPGDSVIVVTTHLGLQDAGDVLEE
ncbi:MAG: Trk system potassium transporter TrkA [Lachnospiraceae bacterium]|nr:Trk system potassium transporter TrkA [Lachnospiraceae bacterium]MBQ2101608.1 Trk system potassium transporter TrkA [Lachnospiraceae bacterium]MBQ3906795.1 Trk system potassium transporter TrkA [Lachnospiraceae bacterium]MCR4598513.1 Trk system potassium transporter TrkA [Acetatifactor sp.]